jgi:hypothetical protein
MAVWHDWERKAAAAFIVFVAVNVYAYLNHAIFAEYANAMEWILGIYITGYAAQQIGTAAKTSAAPPIVKAP